MDSFGGCEETGGMKQKGAEQNVPGRRRAEQHTRGTGNREVAEIGLVIVKTPKLQWSPQDVAPGL